MTTATAPSTHPLVDKHAELLAQASTALAERSYFSRFPESPSPRVYGEGSAEAGQAAYEALRDNAFGGLGDVRTDGQWVGEEVSPYGPALGITYPHLDLDAAFAAAAEAMPAWRDAGARTRAAVCVEIVEQINARSFEIAHSVMHTTGQPFVMAFQAAGPHAQDRALESVVAGLVEQERVPSSVVWEKPGRDKEGNPAPLRMQKDYRIVPRGVALVIGCNTFPTWNGYPGLFASLVTGNPVIVKPHPRAVLPLAISVAVCREVLSAAGFSADLVQLAPEAEGEGLAKVLAERDEVRIIDYTGGPTFGGVARGDRRRPRPAGLHREGRRQHDRRRLDRQPARRARQPRVLAHPLLRPDVHHPAEPLRARATASRPTRATSPSRTSARSSPRRSASSPVTTPAPSSCSARPSTTGCAPTPPGSPRSPRRPAARWCWTRARSATRHTPTRWSARPAW